MRRAEAITVAVLGETPLAGLLYRPDGPMRQAVLLAGGLGITQRFYGPFAAWLADQGHLVMSFDPRGIGASRAAPGRWRALDDVDMLAWARMDFAAAVQHLCAIAKCEQIVVLGHSLGAHHAAMTDSQTQSRIARLVPVAAGSGYWRDWAAASRRKAPLMLHLAGPLLTPLFGYFPGKYIGMVGDLPAGVMRQWSRWCRHPDFAWGAEPALVRPSVESARFPIAAFSFTDDQAMTLHCTEKLLAAMPNAPSTLLRVDPVSMGLSGIGHVGAFRPANAALWPLLEAQIRPV